MESIKAREIEELTDAEVIQVSGGIIFAPVLYAAFVSGAKWGAGVALATYAIQAKFDK